MSAHFTESPKGPPEHGTETLPAFGRTEPGERPVPNQATLRVAARWLSQSQPVVVPTETVYGLAARAADAEAVARIYAIKGRPADNPLIVHVASEAELTRVGGVSTPLGRELARAFWPGPLTLVVHSRGELPWVRAGLDSVAVRCPAHPFARALVEESGPIAAPSANLSGRPSPTRAAHALADLAGRVPLVVDGGSLAHGLESSVVDVRGPEPVLLRPGSVTAEAIEQVTGLHVRTQAETGAPRSPGMKYRHYSPRAELWLYPGGAQALDLIASDADRLRRAGSRVAVISRGRCEADVFVPLPASEEAVGRMLFSWLRELDAEGADVVLVEGVSSAGVGRAVMDRLERAASRVRTRAVDPVRLARVGARSTDVA